MPPQQRANPLIKVNQAHWHTLCVANRCNMEAWWCLRKITQGGNSYWGGWWCPNRAYLMNRQFQITLNCHYTCTGCVSFRLHRISKLSPLWVEDLKHTCPVPKVLEKLTRTEPMPVCGSRDKILQLSPALLMLWLNCYSFRLPGFFSPMDLERKTILTCPSSGNHWVKVDKTEQSRLKGKDI